MKLFNMADAIFSDIEFCQLIKNPEFKEAIKLDFSLLKRG